LKWIGKARHETIGLPGYSNKLARVVLQLANNLSADAKYMNITTHYALPAALGSCAEMTMHRYLPAGTVLPAMWAVMVPVVAKPINETSLEWPRPPPAHRPGIGGGISFGCPGRLLNERGYHRTGELPTSNYNNINGGLYLDNVGTLPRGALWARRG